MNQLLEAIGNAKAELPISGPASTKNATAESDQSAMGAAWRQLTGENLTADSQPDILRAVSPFCHLHGCCNQNSNIEGKCMGGGKAGKGAKGGGRGG